jgi:hypothetical protein
MVDAGSAVLGAGIFAAIMGMFAFFMVVSIAMYVYMGFAFMAIAKKAKLDAPGIAWIPGVGPLIIAYQTANMHWWPWLLLIGFFIPFLNFIAMIVFAVYAVIWQWKLFEEIGKPGWWAILCLITPLNLIFYGIAAWSKD